MDYREASVFTTTEGIDIVAGYLTERGIRGVQIEDAADFQAFLEDTSPHWDYVEEDLLRLKESETRVIFYLPENAQGGEAYNAICGGLEALRRENPAVDLGRLAVETARVSEEDWSTAWKKYYHPLHVGERLTVAPCWEEYTPGPEEIVVTLDPGMAFGPGTHETTRLCMELLEKQVTPGCALLDVGTGSGILAITGLLLGAERAVGVDIDQLAVKIAGENARLNGVEGRLELFCGDLVEQVSGTFDVICANIVADVILRLAESVTRFMRKRTETDRGSALLCSGIIEERRDEVEAGLREAGLTVDEAVNENGWCALLLHL